MWTDPIVEELHKIREEHAAKFDYDLNRINEDLKSKDYHKLFNIIDLPVKRKSVQMVAEKSQEYK
ncbi:MAG: hypothetical protein QG635_1754 [Bacteroidota bacterium]|nr:hypothetical protein [Bacteroidota bacterium]